MAKRLLQTLNKLHTNKDKVSKQNVRNKEHVIVHGVTHMIADTTMNRIFYPRAEVESLAESLSNQRIVMPANHPEGEGGEFISATDPWALASNHIGAYAYNFSMQGDKLISDVAIDPEAASLNKYGEAILTAINENLPMDMSTGFYLNISDETGFGKDGEPYDGVASNLFMDHSAFLPDVVGAKNKTEGVGLHTNSAKDKDGNDIDTDIAELVNNASTPALQLPLAPNDYQWNEAAAIERIKAYTNSTESPSTSYRKFFLEFNQDAVDDFASYSQPFADIIDGVPHAVKQPLANSDSEHAKSYIERFAANKEGFVTKTLNALKSMFTFKSNELSHDQLHSQIYDKLNEGRSREDSSFWPMDIYQSYFIYRGEGGKVFKQPYTVDNDEVVFAGENTEVKRVVEYKPVTNNTDGDLMDRKDIIAILAGKGISVNADISDADLKAELNKAIGGNADEPNTQNNAEAPQWAKDLTAQVNSLAATVNANADKELNDAVAAVVALNKGIDETAAKAMGLDACNAFLAANGKAAFNAHSQQPQDTASNCQSLELPNQEA